MKKFFLHIVLFFVIVAVVDLGFGQLCEMLSAHARGGMMKEVRQIAKEQKADVVVMGSSRAHHHYVPSILTDTLGLTAHNAGFDGNGIVLANGLRCLIYNRYTPSVILYDVTPGFDITTNSMDGNNTRYLGPLRPYYYNEEVRKVLSEVDFFENFKNLSSMFRYNSSIIELLKDQIIVGDFHSDGYSPLFGTMTRSIDDMNSVYETTGDPAISIMGDKAPIDSLKYKILDNFVSTISETDTRLVFIVSPRWKGTNAESLKPIKEICDNYGVEFWDYSSTTEFQKREYFKDRIHLNDYGAYIFSSTIAHRLKQ